MSNSSRSLRRAGLLLVPFVLACGGLVGCGGPDDGGKSPDPGDVETGGSGGGTPRGGSGGSSSPQTGTGGSPSTGGKGGGTSTGGTGGGGTSTGGTGGGGTSTGGTGGGGTSTGGTGGGGTGPVVMPGSFGQPGANPKTAAQASVFDDNKLETWSLTVAPSDWQTLLRTATTEMFVPADLTVGTEKVGKVGLRFKGAYGTLVPCFSNGMQTCPKVSFKVKFDEYEMDKRFKELKRVNLHSMLRDPTQLHDRLAYKIFRDMGVTTSRAVHAKLVINGEYKGLFALVEQMDGRFTADRFPGAADGNLYKEAWPTSTVDSYYKMKLETNEMTAKNDKIIALATELTKAATPAAGAQVLEKWFGLQHLMRVHAVDRAISNWDGYTTFYCSTNPGSTWCGNHNFYVYQHEKEDKFLMLPWDHDNTMSVSTFFDDVPPWDKPPANCMDRYVASGNRVMSAGCDPFFKALAGAKPEYIKAVRELLDGPFQLSKLNADIDRWAAQIKDAVAMDPNGPGLVAWQLAVSGFKRDLEVLRERLEAIRDDKPYTGMGLATKGMNTFETVSRLDYMLGTMSMGSYGIAHYLNKTGAASGNADARFDIASSGGKGQWAWFRMNLAGAVAGKTVSLTGLKQLKIKLKGDNNTRFVRVDIDSPKYKNIWSGVRFGWDATATTAGATVTLDASMLKIPSWGANMGDVLADILANANGLVFTPGVKQGMPDQGFVQIDDIEFVF